MANEYYATTGSPATSSQGASATMRSEFTSVAAGFDKLPTLAGNGSKLVQINSGGTAMAAIALTVGAILFGGAAGALGQDGANLFWDNTAKRLGVGNAAPTVALDVTGAGKFSTGLTVSAGGITATGNSTITGALGGVTTLTASTSVVTPLVGPSTNVQFNFQQNGAIVWAIQGGGTFIPAADNTTDFGAVGSRIHQIFTPIIDSGTAGSLSLRTNNGTEQLRIVNGIASANVLQISGGPAAGNPPQIGVVGPDTNIGQDFWSKGSGQFRFITNSFVDVQLSIIHTAGATRNITVTGSNGGNPTLSTTAGSLAITPAVVLASSLNFSTAAAKIIPGATSISLRNNADSADNLLISDAGVITTRATTLTLGASPTIAVVSGSLAITPSVVIAGASLQVGANPASTANSLAIPYGGIIASRNNANTQDLNLISSLAINGINDVISVGNGAQGVTINGRVQAGAPSASDITSGKFMVWRDTSGATTKLYYNNGGVLQSVALA